ncbi:cell division protein SepF [Rathayibacter sp. VKM Ac-2856]|jgi:cell division inhibitor SepF|uniref:cell division protein SepF n=1 Tax=unclassified Rathayibacter TaxID=2609250 RepID=UPI0015670FA4|nr:MULTISPECIES: cell division protein SepF [unclassified Rathayibacter]NQX06662.1 cell division protein SepF [Rathayibacter sp. VKM Ac-2858]NQX21829.1 cell division protein SepF [Rathayibacter sp. VKM Ac-2856]
MANPLKKTMVYLGLADEEVEYERAETVEAAPATAHRAPVSPVQPVPPVEQAPQQPRATVTPLRKPTPQTPKATAHAEMNEILTVHPKQYRDAQVIAENFRDGIPVIINLSQMSDADARRLIDFASGLSQGLYGRIERVTSKVFLLSPSHITVAGDSASAESDADASFFAKS